MKMPKTIKNAFHTALAFGTAALSLTSCDQKITEHKLLKEVMVDDGIVTLVTMDEKTREIETAYYEPIHGGGHAKPQPTPGTTSLDVLRHPEHLYLKDLPQLSTVSIDEVDGEKIEKTTYIYSDDSIQVNKFKKAMLLITKVQGDKITGHNIGALEALEYHNFTLINKGSPKPGR